MDISVIMITYNHEKYIRKALDSILAQETDNLCYEILICDDASIDNTGEIIREYRNLYPQKIRAFFRKHNSFFPTLNTFYLMSKAKGKYIAFLEGDDYWLSTSKLKIQYECLQNHTEYSACVGKTVLVNDDGSNFNEYDANSIYPYFVNNLYTIKDFQKTTSFPGHGSALFYRNCFDKEKYKILYTASSICGDHVLVMLNVLKGPIHQMPELLSARRMKSQEGQTNYNSLKLNNKYRNYSSVCHFIRLEKYLRNHYDKDFSFAFMTDLICGIYRDTPIRSLVKLFKISADKTRYFKYILIMYLRSLQNNIEVFKGEKALFKGKKRIIIFSAGDYAKKYLDLHGWREQVLFLVDNDPAKQGKSMKGFLIKKPKDIIPYRDKAIVLIANEFYAKEITVQLESLGIYNYYIYHELEKRRLNKIFADKLMESLKG